MSEKTSPLHVLVVDDEQFLLEELEHFLQLNDIVVTTARDATQAIAALTGKPEVTVILTDIRMPGLDGLALTDRILRARGEVDAIEVVLMTGHGTIEAAVAAVRAGAFDFLRKPMQLDETVAVLRRAHDQAMRRRHAEAVHREELTSLRQSYEALRASIAGMQTSAAGIGSSTSELARILSFEFLKPLLPLHVRTAMLQQTEAVPPAVLEAFRQDVHAAGERLQQIADDFTEYLAPADPSGYDWATVPVRGVLESLGHGMSPALEKAEVELTIDVADDLELETDARQLGKLLTRVVTNAIGVTRRFGRIELEAHAAEPDSVTFEVRDKGPGMTPEEQEVARLPFHRAGAMTAPGAGGLGLGLPLAIRAAEQLGGRLTLQSAPNAGTIVKVVLPRHRTPGAG